MSTTYKNTLLDGTQTVAGREVKEEFRILSVGRIPDKLLFPLAFALFFQQIIRNAHSTTKDKNQR